MKTVLPVIDGQAEGASSQATTRSTAGDRSRPSALILSRISGDVQALEAAKPAARSLLRVRG